ncbi:MAG: class I SAM-dependent methyltransferase [Chloroflexota bacterium]|nr:class I SAM-dependent methyltransferase [Chloroflexota bacterium]
MQREGWRFPPERRHVLMDEDRRRWLGPERILSEAAVQPGETVVDLGAGTGFWTEPLSEMVASEGKVYAADIEPVMLEDLQTLIRDRGLENVEIVQSDELSVPLDSGIADLVVLGFVLHEPAEPDLFLQEVIRLLKPEGRLLVAEWQQRPTEGGPPLEYRISAEEAHALLGAAGFSVEEMVSPTEDIYLLLARPFRPNDPEMTAPTV